MPDEALSIDHVFSALADGFTEPERQVIRHGIHLAFRFRALLANLPDTEKISNESEHVALRIRQGLARVAALRDIVADVNQEATLSAYEAVEYSNESIVGNSDLLPDLQKIASDVAQARPDIKLKWNCYPSVAELAEEYSKRMDVLCDGAAPIAERFSALLHTMRLQLTFLANTYC